MFYVMYEYETALNERLYCIKLSEKEQVIWPEKKEERNGCFFVEHRNFVDYSSNYLQHDVVDTSKMEMFPTE